MRIEQTCLVSFVQICDILCYKLPFRGFARPHARPDLEQNRLIHSQKRAVWPTIRQQILTSCYSGIRLVILTTETRIFLILVNIIRRNDKAIYIAHIKFIYRL